METSFSAYPALLHCGIHRNCIDSLPDALTVAEQELLLASPPAALASVHSASHLVSFARHLKDIIDDPIRRVEVDEHVFHAILGVVVFHREIDGTFSTALWQQPEEGCDDWLADFEPWDTPILDFPSTSLWHSMLHEALAQEARQRIANPKKAERWSTWAWALLEERLIASIDLRRLRSRIRGALELDWRTVAMMDWFRREDGRRYLHAVAGYNNCRARIELLSELRRTSPFLALLARWLDIPTAGMRGSCEPGARLKYACYRLGIRRQQWRLLANPKAPLASIFRSFVREFLGARHREPCEDFLGLIRLLEPSKPIDVQVWRTILSMVGTRSQAPGSYTKELTAVGGTLRHIIHLIERGSAPTDPGQRDTDLHEICAWVADENVSRLLPQQRRNGWAYLVRSARIHADRRKRALELESMTWSVPIFPVEADGFTAIPLSSGTDLWVESVAMRHCADTYATRCKAGTTLIFSVRREDGTRYATLAFERRHGGWELAHSGGPANGHIGVTLDGLIAATLVLLNLFRFARSADDDTTGASISEADRRAPFFPKGGAGGDNTCGYKHQS